MLPLNLLLNRNGATSHFQIKMSSNPDQSGNHSPPQPSPAQERIEETLRTLQETLRRLQDSGSIGDQSRPIGRHQVSSS